jgi:hypothetical protein
MTRPALFTQAIADEICTRIAGGESLIALCRDTPHLPARNTIVTWLANDLFGDFHQQYRRARVDQADSLVEQIREIADDSRQDYRNGDKGEPVLDRDHILRSKLRIDTLKWLAGKLNPKTYGDRQMLSLDSENTMPMGYRIVFGNDDAPEA